MIIIKNLDELNEAYRSNKIDRLFISPEAKTVVKESLEFNLNLMIGAYGTEGDGGYLCIIENNIDSSEGEEEYRSELAKYNLSAEDWEFDDVLVQNGLFEVHLQLFVLTEYNLIILYMRKESEE